MSVCMQFFSRSLGDPLSLSSSSRVMSCNSLDAHSEHVVSVGEDGKIVLLNIKHPKPVRVYDEADGCSLNAVTFIKQDVVSELEINICLGAPLLLIFGTDLNPFSSFDSQVLTANMRGQLKLWDLRAASDEPVTSSVLPSDDQIEVGCLSTHPSQTHIVCSGSSDGTIAFWDLRQERHAFTVLKGHDKAVTEVR